MLKGKERRVLVMCVGNLILAMGVYLLKLSLMGNDSYSAMALAISDRLQKDYAIVLITINMIVFIAEICLGRKYIGIGTFVNWFCLGIFVSLYMKIFDNRWTTPEGFFPRFLIMAFAVLLVSLGVSMYQTADLGIAPYDSVSIIMAERLPIPYFWCRMSNDVICAVICYVLGGIVGLGTVICSLGLGPFIQFFDKFVSEKLCGYRKKEQKF